MSSPRKSASPPSAADPATPPVPVQDEEQPDIDVVRHRCCHPQHVFPPTEVEF